MNLRRRLFIGACLTGLAAWLTLYNYAYHHLCDPKVIRLRAWLARRRRHTSHSANCRPPSRRKPPGNVGTRGLWRGAMAVTR